jgi:hypothetical protein
VLNAPLTAFSQILKWAAQANDSAHVFRVDSQPFRKNVVQKLFCRYNMKGLLPKEKLLYSKRTVSMIYFDASQVFASLLSCPLLNRDENFLFHEDKDPFVAPSKAGDIGDINTGECYRKAYEALVKNGSRWRYCASIIRMKRSAHTRSTSQSSRKTSVCSRRMTTSK